MAVRAVAAERVVERAVATEVATVEKVVWAEVARVGAVTVRRRSSD